MVRAGRLEKLRKPGYGEKMGPGWRFVWLVLYYPVSAMIKVRYRHMDRIPQQGPAIIVTNHVSHIDPFLVSKFILDAARAPRFLAKESLFAVPAVGWGMRIMGHIPVKRGTDDARQSLSAAVEALDNGKILVLHPEGTVTRDPQFWPMIGKTGAARLASLVPDVAVIPIAQWGVQEQIDIYQKKIKLVPRPKHMMSVGEPIDLRKFRDLEVTPDVLHDMTEVIMRRLRTDVADLRGEVEPVGDLFYWVRPTEGKPARRPERPADPAVSDKPGDAA